MLERQSTAKSTATKPAEKIRAGSYQAMTKTLKTESTTRTLTGVAFDDSYICAVSTDGRVHVWEPHG